MCNYDSVPKEIVLLGKFGRACIMPSCQSWAQWASVVCGMLLSKGTSLGLETSAAAVHADTTSLQHELQCMIILWLARPVTAMPPERFTRVVNRAAVCHAVCVFQQRTKRPGCRWN